MSQTIMSEDGKRLFPKLLENRFKFSLENYDYTANFQ